MCNKNTMWEIWYSGEKLGEAVSGKLSSQAWHGCYKLAADLVKTHKPDTTFDNYLYKVKKKVTSPEDDLKVALSKLTQKEINLLAAYFKE